MEGDGTSLRDREYRRRKEKVRALKEKVRRLAEAALPTSYGAFRIAVFGVGSSRVEVAAVTRGTITGEPILLRVHSECLTGKSLGSLRCDCRKQLETALELASDKINVNNIAPGMVLTLFNQPTIEDPKEIGRLAVFLASPDADYVTGSTYVMDGGLMQNQGQGA